MCTGIGYIGMLRSLRQVGVIFGKVFVIVSIGSGLEGVGSCERHRICWSIRVVVCSPILIEVRRFVDDGPRLGIKL